MKKQPQVSIIIPTYNRSDLLLETLQSVKNQTFSDWECIVIDDSGNDDLGVKIHQWSGNDNRFRYFKRPNHYPKGASSCRNYGFSQSLGNYIQWLDDDDLLSENKLEIQVSALNKQDNPDVFATCSWDLLWHGKDLELRNVFADVEMVSKDNFYMLLANQQSFVPALAFLATRKLCLQAGEWNVNLTVNDDAEYFNRILVHSKKLLNVDGCYVLYREHNKARLSRKRSDAHIESFFLSLRLMQAYLKKHNVVAKAYFKWKLLKWFLDYKKSHPNIIKKHYYFFRENGINPNFAGYYIIKHSVYKVLYPWYKRKFKN
jgi:glycosyltransferase involved in cell wall biosynthesis